MHAYLSHPVRNFNSVCKPLRTLSYAYEKKTCYDDCKQPHMFVLQVLIRKCKRMEQYRMFNNHCLMEGTTN